MAINLKKGQSIVLSKDGSSQGTLVGGGSAESGLKRVMIGLGWDAAGSGFLAGLFGGGQSVDCDAAVFLCDANGHLIHNDIHDCCVYFNSLKHKSGAIVHQGDNLTGEGEGDDESIMVNLPAVPENIHKLIVTINIYKGSERKQHFGMIKNAFVHIIDLENKKEICRYDLDGKYKGCTGIVVGSLTRQGSAWSFNAIGQAVPNADLLDTFVEMFR